MVVTGQTAFVSIQTYHSISENEKRFPLTLTTFREDASRAAWSESTLLLLTSAALDLDVNMQRQHQRIIFLNYQQNQIALGTKGDKVEHII